VSEQEGVIAHLSKVIRVMAGNARWL